MKVCRWCGKRVRLWRRYCSVCGPRITGDAGIYLQSGGPPCAYMAHLERP